MLFDKGAKPQAIWARRWKVMAMKDIDTWSSDVIKKVILTQDVGNTTFEIEMREFTPYPDDPLARKWKTNGVQMSHQCTPYGIADMKKAAIVFESFAYSNVDAYVEYYVDRADDLLASTYEMALKHARTAEVYNAL